MSNSQRPVIADIASLLFAAALLFTIHLKLLPALLAGLLIFALVDIAVPVHRVAAPDADHPRRMAVALIALLVLILMGIAAFGITWLVKHSGRNIPALMQSMAEIIEHSRENLPAWLLSYIPDDADQLRQALVVWLREHVDLFRLAGAEFARALVHILIGMVIGALISLERTRVGRAPLAASLTASARRLGRAFRRVVFAQLWISSINTLLTGLYLVIILPLFGIELPFTKTMLMITFIAGLVPILGNLVSNAVLVTVSLSQSPTVAFASLTYLVVVHKLEYFLNARIVGGHIRAKAWELLVAMLFMESTFGIAGLIAAPIYYAYFKDELRTRALI